MSTPKKTKEVKFAKPRKLPRLIYELRAVNYMGEPYVSLSPDAKVLHILQRGEMWKLTLPTKK